MDYFITELVKPTKSDFKPLSLSGASSIFHCAIKLFPVHSCHLSFGICSLFFLLLVLVIVGVFIRFFCFILLVFIR